MPSPVSKTISLEEVKVNLGSNWRNNYFTQNARFLFANVIDTSQNGFKALGTPTTSLSANGYYKQSVAYMELGNTGTSDEDNWIAWQLDPAPAKHIYIKFKVAPGAKWCFLGFNDGTLNNSYHVVFDIPASANDFLLQKCVGGSSTTLASEGVDLSSTTYYTIEMLWDIENGRLMVWRDGNLTFNIEDTDLTTLSYVFLRNYSTGSNSKFLLPVVVTWE